MKFTAIPIEAAKATMSVNAHRASEPRDTIYNNLVLPFIQSGYEHFMKVLENDEGEVTYTGFTWADLEADVEPDENGHCGANITAKIQEKNKSLDGCTVEDIRKNVNQHANRQKWHVFCKVIKDGATGELSFILVNESVEAERMKSEKNAATPADNKKK